MCFWPAPCFGKFYRMSQNDCVTFTVFGYISFSLSLLQYCNRKRATFQTVRICGPFLPLFFQALIKTLCINRLPTPLQMLYPTRWSLLRTGCSVTKLKHPNTLVGLPISKGITEITRLSTGALHTGHRWRCPAKDMPRWRFPRTLSSTAAARSKSQERSVVSLLRHRLVETQNLFCWWVATRHMPMLSGNLQVHVAEWVEGEKLSQSQAQSLASKKPLLIYFSCF